jgi:N-acetylglucosamine-6-phosphate deacetylase
MRSVDLQINGYSGVDFNDDGLSADALRCACEALREDGVEGILATVISDTLPELKKRLARLADLREADPMVRELVVGMHLEGPFLSSDAGYAGAHPVAATRQAEVNVARALLDAARGLIRMVTLAPERDPGARTVRFLAEQGIVVAAGHCDCTRDELHAAIDNGLSLFTHFGNGCPAVLPRHDNILQRALSFRDQLTFTLIADGVHVPAFALRNYLDFVGVDRAIVVSDAIAAARLGPGRYRLGSQTVTVGEDRVARDAVGNHFMGSTATMPQMAHLLRDQLHLDQSQIERLTYHNPRKALGMSRQPGEKQELQ